MTLSNRERQALYRRRGADARAKLEMLRALLGEVIDMLQRAIDAKQAQGALPNDGSTDGDILAEQEAWVVRARRELSEQRAADSKP